MVVDDVFGVPSALPSPTLDSLALDLDGGGD